MPIVRRDSKTWPADASRGRDDVIGNRDTVIGKTGDSARELVKLLVGDPYQQGLYEVQLDAVVRRTVTLDAVVR